MFYFLSVKMDVYFINSGSEVLPPTQKDPTLKKKSENRKKNKVGRKKKKEWEEDKQIKFLRGFYSFPGFCTL